jgi:5-methylcytosine-specific restriction protein A
VKRPCLVCGVPSDGSRCLAHQVSGWSAWRPAGDNGYGSAWERIRRVVLEEQPICAVCGIRPSEEVDHIIAKSLGGSDDRGNLRGICTLDHRQRSASQGGQATAARTRGGEGSNGKRTAPGRPLSPPRLARGSGVS